MKNRLVAIWMAVGMLAVAGCGAGMSKNSLPEDSNQEIAVEGGYDSSGWTAGAKDIASAETGAAQDADAAELAAAESEKIIKTYEIALQTRDYDQTIAALQQKLKETGGYQEASESSGSEGYRWCSLTLRIPADQAEDFLAAAGEAGTITHQSAGTENVTLTYVDLESRIEALKTEQESLLRLMEKAEKLEDLLAIQSQLTSVRYELDSYESQMRVLENRISYSTITVDVNEVERVTPQEQKGFFAESWAKLQNTLYGLGQTLRALGIWLIGSLPLLLILGAGAALIVTAFRRIRKKKKTKKE